MQHNLEESQKRSRQRANILKAAESCFIENGIALTSMNDITKRAGIYRRTLYNYYNSREEIASEIFHHYSEQGLNFELSDDLNGFDLLENVIGQWISNMDEFKPYILFAIHFEYHFHRVGNNKKILESGINFHIINLLSHILKKGTEDGSIILPEGDFDMIVQSILHTLLAYIFRVTHREEVLRMESGFSMEHINFSLEIILRGLKA